MNPISKSASRPGNCLVIGIVVLCLAAAGGYWLFTYLTSGSAAADAIDAAARATLEGAGDQLPEAEREEAMVVITDFTDRMREGEVSLEQGTNVILALLEEVSPIIFAMAFEDEFLQTAELSEAEREEARVTFQRFFRGSMTGEIPEAKQEEIYARFPEETEGQNAETLTTEEAREILADMKTAADEAGVPQEVPQQDLSSLIELAINQGMAQAAEAGQTEEMPASEGSGSEETPVPEQSEATGT
ncbi:MAG: hypothetical protein ACFB21_16880 [Opitutales bacterium]